MPDWMSHLLVGLILAELFGIRKKSLVLLGALMPDLISKLLLTSLYFGFFRNLIFDSFHTPLVSFLLVVLIAPLFRYNKIKTILLMSIGLLTHFLSDLMIKHFIVGMRLFFPFSMNVYRFDLIWPEESIYVLIFSLFVYILIKSLRRLKRINLEGLRI